jgi:DedD protein
MDVRIRERLLGALVLVAVIVLLVPALLKGPAKEREEPSSAETRSVEVPLDVAAKSTDDERLVPEPEIARAVSKPVAKPASASAGRPPAVKPIAAPESPAKPGGAAAGADAMLVQRPAWAVQLGAFSSKDKADGLVAHLRSRGYSAFMLEYRAGGQILYRVRVGPEQDRSRAVAIAERLRKDGFKPVVAPHP